jgi:hypothetical protein
MGEMLGSNEFQPSFTPAPTTRAEQSRLSWHTYNNTPTLPAIVWSPPTTLAQDTHVRPEQVTLPFAIQNKCSYFAVVGAPTLRLRAIFICRTNISANTFCFSYLIIYPNLHSPFLCEAVIGAQTVVKNGSCQPILITVLPLTLK